MSYGRKEHVGLTSKYHTERKGEAYLEVYTIKDNDFYAMMSGIPSGDYVRLYVGREMMMSNTPMEYDTQREFLYKAHGDVVIAGLGLGSVVFGIQDKENVTSITVIEKSQDVIDLITSQVTFNDKVKIICADAFEWKPEKGTRFDCAFLDIWPYINSDVYEEMVTIKKWYSKFLKPKSISPNRFKMCWCEYQAKHNERI